MATPMATTMATSNSAATIYGKGIAFPPRIGADGRLAWSAGEANVRENLSVLLLTEPGERIRLQSFGAGLRRFLFEPNTPGTRQAIVEEIDTAIRRWEPRVSLESVSVAEDPDDGRAAIATIVFRLVATQKLERVTLAVTLGG
jgi:phage baseplate assembly protein W